LFGAEDPNAAAALVDSDAEQDEGDAAEADSNDDASSDSDDSDSSTSGVAGAKEGQNTGASDDFVGSSSGTYKRVDKAPARSQPSPGARKTTKPKGATTPAKTTPVEPKGATNPAKTSATDDFVGSSSGTYTRVEEAPAPSQPAEARKPTKSPKGATKPAKTTPVEPLWDKSTMGGGGGSRTGRRARHSKIASVVASQSDTDTVVDDVPETSHPSEARKAATQVQAPVASAEVAAYPILSLSKAPPVGGETESEQEFPLEDDEDDELEVFHVPTMYTLGIVPPPPISSF
jgi:hypothetical protein